MLKLKSQQCYEKNKEQIQEKKRQHNRNNKGKIKEQDRKYKQKNNEATKERGRRYYEKNKERMRQHREKNKDKTAERRRQLRNEKKKSNWYWNSRMKRLCQVMRISWHICWLWSVRPMIFWLEHFFENYVISQCFTTGAKMPFVAVPVAMCASACCYVR